MNDYVVLIVNRYDGYDRYWVTRKTLEEARAFARSYEEDNKYRTEIYELGRNIR